MKHLLEMTLCVEVRLKILGFLGSRNGSFGQLVLLWVWTLLVQNQERGLSSRMWSFFCHFVLVTEMIMIVVLFSLYRTSLARKRFRFCGGKVDYSLYLNDLWKWNRNHLAPTKPHSCSSAAVVHRGENDEDNVRLLGFLSD